MAIDRQKTETVHWHAVFTASRAEKKVRDRLEELGVECFLPVQTVLRQWTYRKSRVVVPVIAGLVFVRVSRQEQVKVLQTKGVVAFLRLKGEAGAAVIPDKQMEDFMFVMDLNPDGVSLDSEMLTVGHKVKVVKGELSGIEGEVAVEANKTYVVIRIKDLLTASVKVPKSYLKIIKD